MKIDELNKEKKDNIINYAMEEFATSGYDKASTNTIVQKAGISKGSIFQYFGNKKMMFFYLYDYAENIIEVYLTNYVDFKHPDLFYRIEELMNQLAMLLIKHPNVMNFVDAAKSEENLEILNEVKKRKRASTDILVKRVFNNVDLTLFKENVDYEKTCFIVSSTLKNLIDKEMESGKKCSEALIIESLKEYIDYFRIVFYK
ncbi:TetR/AcrR family transcriptional regulator [Clostridium grantii]|uniref:Transcriptional regulator, TetR family n=1 Tax=Clostridium grantii DSM 8605 TaxID=1121316 RepID=A0A1M5VTU4_9CLOT|nr:TetR/AcrR family transcriptional regulator [Clostridium grantii]SHH78590.1 transcriptional regulator, TetR family [Clostridium grantii DSM 8605]